MSGFRLGNIIAEVEAGPSAWRAGQAEGLSIVASCSARCLSTWKRSQENVPSRSIRR
jgi:hypothetical protein